MKLLSYEQLLSKVAEYKANFELNKTQAVESLLEAKQIKMLEFKDLTDFEAMQAKISEINAIDSEIQDIKKQSPESVAPKSCYIFNGELFEGRKQVTGRVGNSTKYRFADGDLVKLSYQGIEMPETFRVSHEEGKNPIVIGSNNVPFSPSKLTEKFHVEYLNKELQPNSKGMAGLSHPYWVKAN